MKTSTIDSNDEFSTSEETLSDSSLYSDDNKMQTRPHKSKVVINEDGEEEFVEELPKKKGLIQKIFSHRKTSDGTENEYYVKLRGKSYLHCQWMPEKELLANKAKQLLARYLKVNANNPPNPPYFPEEYTVPEKVISSEEVEGVPFYIVKWKGLDYEDLTHEPLTPLIQDLVDVYNKENVVPSEKDRFIPPHPKPTDFKLITAHDPSKSGKKIRSYQLEGLNFFVNSWYHRKNAILADEMGLGKTCQASIFLNYLHKKQGISGPFIILAPLTTIPHWERELADWTDLKVIAFFGSKDKRKALLNYEFFYPGTTIPKFNVLVTTYEYAIKESKMFEDKFIWQCIIVDEAHRLKNFESKLTVTMHSYKSEFKLLLTGTPLHNNTQELWSLLNFLDEERFNDIQRFKDKFGVLSDAEQITELQAILHPLMLRRLKGDVEKNLAPLEEVIIECGMTSHQRAYYQSIYSKNMEYLHRGAHSSNTTNLQNISMELRKVCNHPYLINGAEDQIIIERKAMMNIDPDVKPDLTFEYESLIRSSGKMILLDKLLAKLKANGHRVLLFSQMTKMLDIIQDYLVYKGYKFERLDGSVKSEIRQGMIDKFNEEGSEDFIFLLCTKAGGLGINLTSADTVIIYDSDWNPQNDLQATARAHRIGQKKNVKVYRLLTAKSYERKMFDTAAIKLGLDQAVLENTKDKPKNDDMEKLLRLGAYYAFEEDDGSAEKFNEEDIDTILSKSKTIKHEQVGSAEGSTFSKLTFDLETDDIDVSAPDFWMKYMPQVKEDTILDDVPMAMRKRLQRESSMDSSISAEELASMAVKMTSDDDDYNWSKKKLTTLQQCLTRYGWGRWNAIQKDFDPNCPLPTLKAVCHCLVKLWINLLEEPDPLLQMIYDNGTNQETSRWEIKFMKLKRDDLASIASAGSGNLQRIHRLNTMHFINMIVSACMNPPEGLEIGNVTAGKPADWWTEQDDRALVYGVFKNGYGNYNEIQFSQTEELQQKSLNNRIKAIVNQKKLNLIKDGSGQAAMTTTKGWTRKEQKAVVSSICNFGYPDPIKFMSKTETILKSPEQVDEFVNNLIKYCNEFKEEKDEPDASNLAEKLTFYQAMRIRKRYELFKAAREFLSKCEEGKLTKSDRRILEIFCDKGYLASLEDEEMKGLLGEDHSESKLTKKIQQMQRSGEPHSRNGILTLHSFAIPDYKKDKNGNPIFPIKVSQNLIINSMGTVVWDRPAFHSERYLYPDGFETERLYQSCLDLDDKIWYKSSIHDTGDDTPVFRVTVPNSDLVFEGAAPSKPWLLVIKAIEDLKREQGLAANRSMTISGPDQYGLTNNLVMHLMRDMPGAEKCSRYIRPRADDEGDETSEEENKQKQEKPTRTSSRRKSRPSFAELSDDDEEEYEERESSDSEQEQDQKQQETENKPARKPLIKLAIKRSQEKLELKFDFTKLVEAKEKNDASLVISTPSLLQENAISAPVPALADNRIEVAVKAMAESMN
ncbi:F/Y-rich N-terminus family protein [Trichomonas vaginalis G3]|uniref:F/Y-rich N-terminus family protein n=1 Tax=Trichomonas vaginalis (strain ATCC PRA-98 / G3) TaxID=412133 RepID=A2FPM0_TRIV3|nr:histone methyltransferase activity (H3-K4 specific) [Trichomonas vaginalis G3]EAX93144.1 F/Y-rich N-terminus family protein [Trichomonas vaginalis G3]KAI5502004.1 histone methyltransferase activity (H3-K4 specific) [Trichomonas vaginalis G3]|eukprot:XP_001306074.1 F/Y-rich N-terminus family protein [Trichomonas vaginalis G3]